ncbi:MAG TPA: 2-C-methyl-D-erythritol 4-phosphate cytidylyltransferase [Gemmatimonadaceae bacterium]|nr:2-C-methyl-D-erythritol 4-phosphate cytidylyltransferase [Gemmatimonadaceae bacterium]
MGEPGSGMREAGSGSRDVGVIIVAAGSGTRTESPELKQFRWVAGKPMLLHSIQTFQAMSDVAMVVCVLPREYVGDPPPWIFQSDSDRLLLSVGGRHRGESVANGLEDLPTECEIVVVHDAARPLVSAETIRRVIDEARKGNGAVAALPVADTLKRADSSGKVIETVDRFGIWRAQTPQAFPREIIVRAHREAREADRVATDDAALCEGIGLPVILVRGSERAVKITEETDFALAEALSIFRE